MLLAKVSVLKNTTRGFQLHGLKINYKIWGTQPKKETYEDIFKNEIDFFFSDFSSWWIQLQIHWSNLLSLYS